METRWSLVVLAASALYALIALPNASAHGLVEQPSSRAWFCGAVTKLNQVLYPDPNNPAQYPQCGDAFKSVDENVPYQFMAILSHSRGAYDALATGKLDTLPKNVCGYDSVTFKGGASPWDKAINWPTTPIKAGQQEFVWNIHWGPHFDDTEHFRYWITKSDYKFVPGEPLKWSDLESKPFCDLEYFDKLQNNPSIIADKANSKFRTSCNVPQRTGRHVIYSEWGREGTNNQRTGGTDERFHSCSDVSFDAAAPGLPKAVISAVGDTVYGAGTVQLRAEQSTGDQLKYSWRIESANPNWYQLTDATSATAKLVMAAPPVNTAGTLTVTLSVTDRYQKSSSVAAVIKHLPASSHYEWQDLGLLRGETMQGGDKLRLRTMDKQGASQYYPKNGVTLTQENVQPTSWPYALGVAVNALDVDVAIGVLGADGKSLKPVRESNVNKIYTRNPTIQNVYLEVERQLAPNQGCSVTMQDGASAWWAGLQVATKNAKTVLDFGASVDLSKLQIQSTDYDVKVDGSKVILIKKSAWINETSPAYVGLQGNNVSALISLKAPGCKGE